jgi:SAM-dependent methyltransferase
MHLPCPVCSGETAHLFTSPYVPVWRCTNSACGHLFAAGAAPDRGVMEPLEEEASSSDFRSRDERLVGRWTECGWLFDGARVLDVGAGTGHIDEAIRDAASPCAVVCVEAGHALALSLARRGFAVHRTLDALLPATILFDFVLLIEVIEHVPDPVGLLVMLRRLISGDAVVFITTPCGGPWLRRSKNAFGRPEHVQFFTERSLAFALRRSGFTRRDFVTMPELYPRERGLVGSLKFLLRPSIQPLIDGLLGHTHLVVVARA